MAPNVSWLRQCRRAGLYEQGKAIYEEGGLNLANLTDEQQIEAEDDYRICVRRGRDDETKPRRQRPKTTEDDQEETTMTRTFYGKVHGNTIEFDQHLGVPDGLEVEVQIKVISPTGKWGEGILRTAGALADDPYWDAIMEEVHQARKIERRPQMEGE
ncbi:MAG: hypothetical protein ACLQU5_18995 [Isosphaeraceae bacterium]